ncbi:MAG TPA: zinc metalloprotease HtpX [Nitrososphaeraceae archaeon]|nr:zinc metalloprotease HtpX [Nitrososphaeraceae archaeon]
MVTVRSLIQLSSISRTPSWQRRDNGLTIRMILSFAILALLFVVFLSVLAYVGLGIIPITIIASLMVLAQWYFSDKIVLWMSRAKVVTRDQFPKLHDIVERIVARNNLPKPKIAVIDTNMPNAFATGKSKKSSIVAVTTGLMDTLDDPEELESVIAHELTHIRNRDAIVLTLVSLLPTVAWYLVQFGFYGGLYGGMGYGRDRNNGGVMIIVIVVAVLVFVISFLIVRAISRYREFSADRGAAQMTGKPVKLANALMKISGSMRRVPTKDLRQVEGLNAFFIIPAISGSTIGNLFSTHPPTEKRVQKLMEMEASMS